MNGKSLESMGATLLSGAYSELMKPAPLKDYIENDDPLVHGVQVLVHTEGENEDPHPFVDEREVTLTFLIEGSSESDFMSKYSSFVAELHRGKVDLYVSELGETFKLFYLNCTQYDNYRLNACKMAIKFREPNPTDRK